MDRQDLSDKEFIEQVTNLLKGFHEENEQTDEDARIALIVMREFKPKLHQFLLNNKDFLKIVFRREDVIDGECRYDMRTCMDEEVINDVHNLGFIYCDENSKPDRLFFEHI